MLETALVAGVAGFVGMLVALMLRKLYFKWRWKRSGERVYRIIDILNEPNEVLGDMVWKEEKPNEVHRGVSSR